MKSMTGYGEAVAHGQETKVVVQVRTLNHRHLDIQVRAPREYLFIEEAIRQRIRRRLSRGRVELFITRSPHKGRGRKLDLDEDLMGQYLQSIRRAQRKFGLKGEADISLVANLPDLFQLGEKGVKQEDERRLVLATLESALKNLQRSREREGRNLRLDIQSQLKHLEAVCSGLVKEAKRIRASLEDFLPLRSEGHLPDGPGERPGANNESIKGDINEEVVRLKSHLKELARLVGRREPVGKKIDFLLQEVQRELNTISSKAPQLSVVQLVLQGKGGVEKIREQAQNVE